MFDFQEIFKEQLTTEKPFTKGNVNGILALLSNTSTPRQIMTRSKELKSKIGIKRLLYYIVDMNVDGTPKKQRMDKVWEDEFDKLQTILSEYNFMGNNGVIPQFANKNIK
jgi:hypothetical protein